MNTVKSLGLVGLAVSALFATQAFATTCPAGQEGSPTCISTTSTESTLAQLFDAGTAGSIFSSGPGINPYTDQVTPSSYWQLGGTGASENTVVLTLTGNTSTNTFGIFSQSDPTQMLKLFAGGATQGFQTSLQYFPLAGTLKVTESDAFGNTVYTNTVNAAGFTTFGYYLDVPNNSATFYSDSSLNQDGIAHAVAYAGDGQNTVAFNGLKFLSGEFLLAWEDTPAGTSDLDYNDFIVMVESVHPVPEPAVLGMFGLGVLLLGGFTVLRRRSYKA